MVYSFRVVLRSMRRSGVGLCTTRLHVDTGRVDGVRIEFAGLDNDLRFRNGDAAARGSHGIEVACGPAIDEVSVRIRFPGLDQGQVGVEMPRSRM